MIFFLYFSRLNDLKKRMKDDKAPSLQNEVKEIQKQIDNLEYMFMINLFFWFTQLVSISMAILHQRSVRMRVSVQIRCYDSLVHLLYNW